MVARSVELTNYGTEYVQTDRVVLPILTARSDHVPHLQLAELVVGATAAAVAGGAHAAPYVDLLHLLRDTKAPQMGARASGS